MYHVNIRLCDVFVGLYLFYGVACSRAKNYKETEEKQEITIRNSKD